MYQEEKHKTLWENFGCPRIFQFNIPQNNHSRDVI